MANELNITYPSGNTLYVVLSNAVGQVYNGAAFETPQDANWATYDIALTEAGTTQIYRGDMPAIAAGVYAFTARLRAGGAPAVGDIALGVGIMQWDGTAEIGLDDIPADVWTYTPRTLTTATSPVTVLTGTDVTITRGDTLDLDIAGLGDISGRTRLWFTVRGALDQPDTASIIQIDEATGLIVLNGVTVPAARNANGSITVTDAVAGDITIALAAVESDDLVIQGGLSYDVQFLSAAGVQTLTLAQARVGADVTRSIT